MHSVGQCLWFNGQAEEAAAFYVSVFDGGKVLETATYLSGSPSPFPPGSVLTVKFVLDGVEFLALNGGPDFTFTPAISIVVNCDTQDEVDHFWDRLSEGGAPGPCGWLTDKFGVSWQVAPRLLDELLASADREAAQRVFTAMLAMGKIEIDALQRAYDNL